MTAHRTRRHKSKVPRPIEGDPAQIEKNRAVIELLRSWCEVGDEEAQEQQETFEALQKGIDEERARLGMRLLFS
jgi:hypothetical protein